MLWPFSPRGSGEFDFPATAASSVTVVVQEVAKANASYWLADQSGSGQIQ